MNWSGQLPRAAVVVVAALMAADLSSTMAGLRGPHKAPAPRIHRAPPAVAMDATRISNAHLFGSESSRAAPEAAAVEKELALALTGTLATRNPAEGYAILGEKGQAGHLYHTGAALGDGLSGHLYQTFADHVVLELDGRFETLKLPNQLTPGLLTDSVAPPDPGPPAASVASLGIDPAGRTNAEAWFELLHPQHQVVGNQSVGIKLRPDARLQRQYDLRYNDILTAVNGVEISGPESFDYLHEALQSPGKSLALTVMRDGVQQVLTVAVADGP